MDDLSYKEKKRLSLHSQAINQKKKKNIKGLKLREESNMSSKSHELTGYVQAKLPGRWEILHYLELTLTASYFLENQSATRTVSS